MSDVSGLADEAQAINKNQYEYEQIGKRNPS